VLALPRGDVLPANPAVAAAADEHLPVWSLSHECGPAAVLGSLMGLASAQSNHLAGSFYRAGVKHQERVSTQLLSRQSTGPHHSFLSCITVSRLVKFLMQLLLCASVLHEGPCKDPVPLSTCCCHMML
jgi:hypothetical protein